MTEDELGVEYHTALLGQLSAVKYLFERERRCFAVDELLPWLAGVFDKDTLRDELLHDSRFVPVGGEEDDEYFVSQSSLFRWWSSLTLRLALAGRVQLSSRQLALAFSHLRPSGQWAAPPTALVAFGDKFGFALPAWSPGYFVFPISAIIRHFPSSLLACTEAILWDMFARSKERGVRAPSILTAVRAVMKGRHHLRAQALLLRFGLGVEHPLNLEEAGEVLGCTRERMRQIELCFFRNLLHGTSMRPFAEALLCNVMRNRTQLLPSNPNRRNSIAFLARCTGVPIVEVSGTDVAVLGATAFGDSHIPSEFPVRLHIETVASAIGLDNHLSLRDIRLLADAVVRTNIRRLTKSQRVFLALRQIGRPAHYSEVASVYNDLFSDRPLSEHNVHASLTMEEHGIVWIGVRGTYALQEWGYEHPRQPLFDLVAGIVRQMYLKTGRPVPFQTIIAEVGKHRRIVRQTSLVIASHFNPHLLRVHNDSFVPAEPEKINRGTKEAVHELSQILQDFEREVPADSNADD